MSSLQAPQTEATAGKKVRLSSEQTEYTLSLGGRYAGTQHWEVDAEGRLLVARVQTDFAGVLPQVRRVQVSKVDARSFASQHYAEGDGRGRANFETVFDSASGQVSLRQGRDEASAPLTTDYHDPVSLLLWLRTLEGQDRATARLTGGHTLIQRLADAEVGGQVCWVYFLRPGNAYVYVEQGAGRRIMRLIQPTEFGVLEADLGSAPRSRENRSEGKTRRRASREGR